MTFRTFFKIVEIQTKLASIFPFLIGVLFSISYFKEFHVVNTLIFLVGMLIFDMATTAINNYMDFKKAKSEIYKYNENIIGQAGTSPRLVGILIIAMLMMTAVIGGILFLRTGWLLLIMGGICCFIGVFYTFGPIPLSRMPLGELFSGFTMGLGIFAITIYINTLNQRPLDLVIDFQTGLFSLSGQFWSVFAVVLASLPMVFTIADIMLANNLRDLDTDIVNQRYTLVYYIGKEKSMQLFCWLIYACYVVILLGLICSIFDWPILIVFGSLPKVLSNLTAFKTALPHPKSFRYSIANLVIFNSFYALGLLLSIII